MNYFDFLCENYPEKKDLLWVYKFPMDHHMYSYGNHLSISWEEKDKNRIKVNLLYLWNRYFKNVKVSIKNAIISDAPKKVNARLEEEGYPICSLESCLSAKSFYFIYNFRSFDFNIFLSSNFEKRINAIIEEMTIFFDRHKIRFLLLSNDVLPIHRMAIIAAQRTGIPSGVFLHGLPGIYNLVDNFGADYTFVWGDALKENYIKLGCKRDIIVTGNPIYSDAEELPGSHDKVLVISFCAGDALDGDSRDIGDRGLCIQYVYMVERTLKSVGVRQAFLRVHPHENPEWYKKYIDNSFYLIDNKPLTSSLSTAKYVVGPISSLLIDSISHNIPYYPFIITKDLNFHSYDIVPPFRKEDGLPVAYSENELANNICKRNYVKNGSISSYYDKEFDLSQITKHFLSVR